MPHTWSGEPRCLQDFHEETEGLKLFSIVDLHTVILTHNCCCIAVVLEAAKRPSKSDLEISLCNWVENEVPEENALTDG